MSLADTIFGTPGTTNYIRSGGSSASPGFRFSQALYNYLPSIFQQQFPTYQGSLDPGLSPSIQDAIRRSQGYAQSGPSEILQGVQGTLGNFMSPNFLNPWNAMMTQVPNYGGANMDQRIYGGQPAGSYGNFGGANSSMGGSSANPGPGFAPGEPTPGGMNTRGFPAPGGAGGLGGGMIPPLGQGGPGGGASGAFGMGFNDAQKALAQQYAGNPNGLNSALAGRYGMNQYGQQDDGRSQFMHSTDHLSALQRTLGREPTFDEVQQSLRSGPGAIEQARSLFMQDDPNGGANWGQGQKDYASLVNQYGLAKGGQMFEQQFGNGPMWAGGAPGQAGGSAPGMPPLGSGGPASPPIAAPRPATPMGGSVGGGDPMNGGVSQDPMNGGGPILSRPRTPMPGGGVGAGGGISVSPSPPSTTPGGLPPLGAKPGQTYGGYTAEQLNANPALGDKLGANARGRLGLPPLGAKGPTDVGVAKPINRPAGTVDVRPGRPGSTDQTPKPRPGLPLNPVRNPNRRPGAGGARTTGPR